MRLPLVLAITLATGHAIAHVGPSKDDNNRYLKLSPHADRVRLAYTVFFGEVPGLKARATIDADRDGTISEAEAQAFGDKLAAEVAAALDISLDNTQHRLAWAEVVVGMGTPAVRAGAFSIDMITHLCLAPSGGKHHLVIRDRFKLTRPGETEIKIEDGAGITITTAKVGAMADPAHQWKLVGPGGPLADDGIELRFDVGPNAPPSSSPCAAPDAAAPAGERDRSIPAGYIIAAGAVVAFILALLVTALRKKR